MKKTLLGSEVNEITLPINGREMTFSEEELIAILEKHFNETKKGQTRKEGEYFKINPKAIDRTLFKKRRKDFHQEKTRKLILKAFAQVDANPKRYLKPFNIMVIKNTWYPEHKTVKELKKLVEDSGDHMADWVEQALQWAQRIANGEDWETICNTSDTAKWFRLVVWKDDFFRLVGGANEVGNNAPATSVYDFSYSSSNSFNYAVPLVVLY